MGKKVVHVFSSFGRGGIQVRAASLMGRFPGGIRHFLLPMGGDRRGLSLIPSSLSLELLSPPGEKNFLRATLALRSLLKKIGPDLVLTYNWGAVEALAGALAAGIPRVIHHEEGFGPEESRRLFLRRNLARRLLLKGAAALVVPSKTLSRIAREKWRVPEGKLRYLPNGVDVERFHPWERNPDRPFRAGFMGGLRPEKDPILLLRAFHRARLPEGSLLLLAGAGPEEARLRREVHRLGLEGRVRFLGLLADPAPFYGEIDVFLLSSRTEQMPLVVLEAMASGLPVVSTDVGDVREMVAEPNRPFLAPPGGEIPFARCLETLAADPELRAGIGGANRARCEADYALDRCLERYMDLYMRVLEGRSG